METETYIFPNLPRKSGSYKVTCPTCGQSIITFRVTKYAASTGIRWAYKSITCRKCGTMRDGLLPR